MHGVFGGRDDSRWTHFPVPRGPPVLQRLPCWPGWGEGFVRVLWVTAGQRSQPSAGTDAGVTVEVQSTKTVAFILLEDYRSTTAAVLTVEQSQVEKMPPARYMYCETVC